MKYKDLGCIFSSGELKQLGVTLCTSLRNLNNYVQKSNFVHNNEYLERRIKYA